MVGVGKVVYFHFKVELNPLFQLEIECVFG